MRTKYFIAIIMAIIFMTGFGFTASSVSAQTRHPKYIARRTASGRVVYYKRPNYYQRHRKLVNIGGGAVGGMVVGGLIGGRRGAGIGTLLGAGTGAIVTHKQHSKNY